MVVGKYVDGRDLTYDAEGGGFAVGGAPITISQALEYDASGQIEWASDETRTWARSLGAPPVSQAPAAAVTASSATTSNVDALTPGTGKKPWFKKWWVWAIAVVLVVAIASTRAPASDSGTGSSAATTAPSVAPEPSTAAPQDVAPAEPIPAEPTAAELMDGNFGTFAALSKSGRGDGIVKVPVDAVGAIVTATHSGSSNFAIEALDAGNKTTGLLVNEIGNYRGVTMFTADEAPVKLKVTADGSWTVKIAPVSSAKTATSSNSGSGDAVLLYEGIAADWKFTHSGSSNFAVKYLSTEGNDLLVNEIGKYSGIVPAAAGPAVVVINADGKWTMVAQ